MQEIKRNNMQYLKKSVFLGLLFYVLFGMNLSKIH